MSSSFKDEQKKKKNRVSPVQLRRYKKNIDIENLKENILDIGLLSDYLEDIESKIDENSNSNEELYSQILELRNRIEKIESYLNFKQDRNNY